jgi:AcrR family transcriptional regulator
MTRSRGGRTAEAIHEAAANLFYRQGYAATSLREIAGEVGIQVGSLYNHIESKDELLRTLMERIMGELLSAMREATAEVAGPDERLIAALDCHLRFHATHSRDVFIGNTELRSLPDEQRRQVISQRDDYEQLLRRFVREACAERGAPVSHDFRLETYAIVAIGTHVASWYRTGGPMTLDQVVDGYTATILRLLGLPTKPTALAS